MTTVPEVVLASGSSTRRAMIERAGLAVRVDPPRVDEDEIKRALRAEGAAVAEVAESLAELKAVRTSRRVPDALVIGADQMLECDGAWFDKPTDRQAAADSLRALRGKTHRLVTAAVVVQGGRRVWHTIDTADLTMRSISDAFIEDYLDRLGDDAFASVGAYQLEGLGAQLFDRVEGDVFTILGLPLLPLFDFLRSWKVVPT